MVNYINGTSAAETLFGTNNESDVIHGYGGDDVIRDRDGDWYSGLDKFYGGAGDDTLKSLCGDALLDGGSGADVFIFYAGKTNGVGWDADIYMDGDDFLTIQNTDDGFTIQHIGFNGEDMRITVDVEGGVESTITVHGVDGYRPNQGDMDFR